MHLCIFFFTHFFHCVFAVVYACTWTCMQSVYMCEFSSTKLNSMQCSQEKHKGTTIAMSQANWTTMNLFIDLHIAQLVGTQRGEPAVTIHNWSAYLGEHFRIVPHLNTFQHITFSADKPWVVTMKEFSDNQQGSGTFIVRLESSAVMVQKISHAQSHLFPSIETCQMNLKRRRELQIISHLLATLVSYCSINLHMYRCLQYSECLIYIQQMIKSMLLF